MAAGQFDIPTHLMQTLTIAETGRSQGAGLRPWPWTINHAGQGHWFDTAEAMQAFAQQLLTSGDRSFDVGCFQLNYRWHSSHFTSLAEMSAPESNANYAAYFLREKFSESGSWRTAVGAYHSQTEEYATAYLARFEAVFAQTSAHEPSAAVNDSAPSEPLLNNYPLLMAGGSGQRGSLVPMVEGMQPLVGAVE